MIGNYSPLSILKDIETLKKRINELKNKNNELENTLQLMNKNISKKIPSTSITDLTVAGDPLQVLKNKWNELSDGNQIVTVGCGSINTAIVQKALNGQYGCALIIGYDVGAPIYATKVLEDWSHSVLS